MAYIYPPILHYYKTLYKNMLKLSFLKYMNSPISGYNVEAFGEAMKFVDEFSLRNFSTNDNDNSGKVKVNRTIYQIAWDEVFSMCCDWD